MMYRHVPSDWRRITSVVLASRSTAEPSGPAPLSIQLLLTSATSPMIRTRLRSSRFRSFSARKPCRRSRIAARPVHHLASLGDEYRVWFIERQNLVDVTTVEGVLESGTGISFGCVAGMLRV
jgi:hypothetical protein